MAGEGTLVGDVDEELDDGRDDDVGGDGELDGAGSDDINADDLAEAAEADENNEDDDGDQDDDGLVTLDALEAEELEIVETDESATMLVDEASEIMAIRREEMTMDIEAGAQRGDEFVCQSCFLVLKASQLANKRKMLCVDCV